MLNFEKKKIFDAIFQQKLVKIPKNSASMTNPELQKN